MHPNLRSGAVVLSGATVEVQKSIPNTRPTMGVLLQTIPHERARFCDSGAAGPLRVNLSSVSQVPAHAIRDPATRRLPIRQDGKHGPEIRAATTSSTHRWSRNQNSNKPFHQVKGRFKTSVSSADTLEGQHRWVSLRPARRRVLRIRIAAAWLPEFRPAVR